MATAKFSDKIVELYEAYVAAREVMKLDPYMNTRAEKALHTRRFNKLHDACTAEGLNPMTVLCQLDEERRDKSVIRIEM